MKRIVWIVALVIGAVGLYLARGSARAIAGPRRAERGRYLAEAIGCSDCHTPKKLGPHGPVLDTERLLSGHPEGPSLPPAPNLGNGPWAAVGTWDLTAWSGPWGGELRDELDARREHGPRELVGRGVRRRAPDRPPHGRVAAHPSPDAGRRIGVSATTT